MEFKTKLSIADILVSDNIANDLSDDEVSAIGREVIRTYEMDRASRYDWEKRTEESLKLALQVVENKSFPWTNASNIKFPLITIAALQYHARAYPALIPGTDVVKCRVIGTDETSEETRRAERIQTHMSYQFLEEDEAWEDQMDKVLITQPIIGCAFKKTYYDPSLKHNVSENILAKDLVVDYWTKSLDTANRISHVLYLTSNDIHERIARGLFRDVDINEPGITQQTTLQLAQNKEQGVNPPQQDHSKPKEFIEQHVSFDLDGDGYEEPYIAVVHKESKTLMRLVARFFPSSIEYANNNKGEIVAIKPETYFTKYSFIPSPDGGFYDLGFGALLGPLNESINTLINQLVDAGTMSNTAGGFLSRGIKMRGGAMSFAPNEWKPVDSTGDDLRKGIVPLPVREPSQVLFTLLSLLINYGERIGGAVDIMVGENPGQNTPAETSRTMAEQGMKIFSGIFKRTYRSFKQEIKKAYRLNQLYFDKPIYFGDIKVEPKDYEVNSNNIFPAADPHMVSDSQRVNQAQMLVSLAANAPGYDMYQVQKRVLAAWRISDIEQVLPDPKGPNAIKQAPHYKVQEAQVKVEGKMKEIEAKMQMHIMKLQQEAEVNRGKIELMEAQALAALEQADSIKAGQDIQLLQTQISAAKHHQDGILASLQLMHDMSVEYKKDSLTASPAKE